jgi:hypothetical protein
MWRVAIAEHNLGRAGAVVDSQVDPSIRAPGFSVSGQENPRVPVTFHLLRLMITIHNHL